MTGFFREHSLTRQFALWSFPLFCLAGGALIFFHFVAVQKSIHTAAEHTAVANQATLINALWPSFGDFLLSERASAQTAQTPAPEVHAIRELVKSHTENTKILKVKIYSPTGRTVFSTDFSQIGKEYGHTDGFQAAIAGKVKSDVSSREYYNGIHAEYRDVHVMGTYLPVYTPGTEAGIAAVSEIYIDVSETAHYPFQATAFLFSSGFTVLALLGVFLALIYVVSRLERRLARAHQERVRMTAELTRVEYLNKAKSDFLAQIGHELRTPLNAILGFAETIRDQIFGPDQTQRYIDYAGYIHRSGQHLLGLVNDILDFDRLETGRMAVKVEPCDLAEKLEDVAALLGGLVADQRVKLDLQVDKRPMPIRTDPLKATQILLNIMSNAAKFTPQGGTILVRLFRPQNSDDVVYKCRDNGIGISDDQMALIMSSVGRTDSALTSKGGGVGLGLPITKQLVELLNGEFDIKSQEGKGTTVTIRFRDIETQQSQNAA